MEISPAIVGAFITFSLGVLTMIRPHAVGKFVNNEPDNSTARAQWRAVGGRLTILAIVAIIFNTTLVYQVVGASWLGAGVARMISAIIDRKFTGPTVMLMLGELAFAALFFIQI